VYPFVLTLHSLTRWAVVVLGVAALATALLGWFGKKPWNERDRKIGSFLAISMDIQLLLGLLLYGVLSPVTQRAFSDFGGAMRDRELRFWAVEHIFLMVVAVVLVHVGQVVSKRAPNDTARYRRLAIFFGLTILCVFLAIPWDSRPLLRFG
jgi:uncharacterized membrane protein YozB (DUF420 family)